MVVVVVVVVAVAVVLFVEVVLVVVVVVVVGVVVCSLPVDNATIAALCGATTSVTLPRVFGLHLGTLQGSHPFRLSTLLT